MEREKEERKEGLLHTMQAHPYTLVSTTAHVKYFAMTCQSPVTEQQFCPFDTYNTHNGQKDKKKHNIHTQTTTWRKVRGYTLFSWESSKMHCHKHTRQHARTYLPQAHKYEYKSNLHYSSKWKLVYKKSAANIRAVSWSICHRDSLAPASESDPQLA